MGSTRLGDAFSLVFGAWGARPGVRRSIIILAIVMMVGGAGLLAYPTFTDIYTANQQKKLATEFASPKFKTQFAAGRVASGQVLTRIEIDAIQVNALIVEGADEGALRAGSGHYPKTAYPCKPGNVAIAGHRTTFGKPFARLDELKVGDKITLSTPQTKCTYKVSIMDSERSKPRPSPESGAWITDPGNVSVLNALPGSWLTLTTCHPKHSAAQRLILRAEMVSA